MPPTRYRLKLKSLQFLSAVDSPAQGDGALALLLKSGTADNINLTATVTKTNDELGLVFGHAFASSLDGGASPHVDYQDDAIDPDFLKAAMEFVEGGGATDVNHDGEQDGRIVFAWPLLPEVNEALGIKSDVHGLAVAIKPSPETYARYKSGELKGFSIQGVGEREPLEAAKGLDDATIKAERDRIEANIAAEKRAAEEEARYERQWHDMFDGFVRAYGEKHAVESAKTAPNKHGASWLEKRSKGPEPQGYEAFAKALGTSYEKALKAWDAAQAAFVKANPDRSPLYFSESADAQRLYQAMDDARRRQESGDVEAFVTARSKPEADRLAALTTQVGKQVEEFSIMHNFDPYAARERLARISPSFAALVAEHSDAYKAHSEARRQARLDAQSFIGNTKAAKKLADASALEKAALDERRQGLTPSMLKLDQLAEQHAKSHGVSISKAMGEVMNTPEGQALYNAGYRERLRGQGGV